MDCSILTFFANFAHLLYLLLFLFFIFDSRYVDQGKNPELYTEDCLKRTLDKNEEVKAKVEAYKVIYQYYSMVGVYVRTAVFKLTREK